VSPRRVLRLLCDNEFGKGSADRIVTIQRLGPGPRCPIEALQAEMRRSPDVRATVLAWNDQEVPLTGTETAVRVPWKPSLRVLVAARTKTGAARLEDLCAELASQLPADTVSVVACRGNDAPLCVAPPQAPPGAEFMCELEGIASGAWLTGIVSADTGQAKDLVNLWRARMTVQEDGSCWELRNGQPAALLCSTCDWEYESLRAARGMVRREGLIKDSLIGLCMLQVSFTQTEAHLLRLADERAHTSAGPWLSRCDNDDDDDTGAGEETVDDGYEDEEDDEDDDEDDALRTAMARSIITIASRRVMDWRRAMGGERPNPKPRLHGRSS